MLFLHFVFVQLRILGFAVFCMTSLTLKYSVNKERNMKAYAWLDMIRFTALSALPKHG